MFEMTLALRHNCSHTCASFGFRKKMNINLNLNRNVNIAGQGKQEMHRGKKKAHVDTTFTGLIEVSTLLWLCYQPIICLETALKIACWNYT